MSDPKAKTTKRSVVQKTRAHDNLYDPVYESSSGEAGHFRRFQSTRKIESIPKYKTMFSDHRLNREYRVKAEKHTVAIQPPQGTHKQTGVSSHNLMGRDRLLFVKRPNVPFLHNLPSQVLLSNHERNSKQAADESTMKEPTPRVKTVGVQTLYRDSETQTDPYTPDYILTEGAPEPEVLSIAHFSSANGMLPVASHEVKIINRMRQKREFLKTLPEITDAKSMEKRKKMLADQERKEWSYREIEMQEEQNAKLQQLVDKLRKRDAKTQEYLNRRIEVLKQSKAKKRNDAYTQIHHQRVKGYRKAGRADIKKNSKKKRDVISEYADHESRVYAPVARVGRAPLKNQVVDYGIPLIQDYRGLVSLEKVIPQKYIRDKEPEKPDISVKLNRREQQKKADLAHVDRQLHGIEAGSGEGTIENKYKNIMPTVRPNTPEILGEDEEDLNDASVILQKLVRGRAVQNSMFEEKTRCLPLIKELQCDPSNADEIDEQGDLRKSLLQGVDLITGAIVSHTLDFMAKRSVQNSEQKQVLALASEAEEERRKREAEEAGRRQAEAAMFAKQDEATDIVIGVHQNTVDSFIDHIITESIHAVSSETGSEAVSKLQSAKLSGKDESNREVVSSLVKDFLLPEVERQRKEHDKNVADARFVHTAHGAVVGAMKEVHQALAPES